MYIIIGVWGGHNRIYAAFKFFLYTLLGSLLTLIAMLYLYNATNTFDILAWHNARLDIVEQILLFFAFFMAFAVKVPMVPFHIWLPEAHVEAPTAGSVMLAGVLLKLGTYGFIRFSIPLFPEASAYFTPFMFTMSIVAIVYTSLTTLRQGDLKKIIAYSSVAHMGFVTLGLFTGNVVGLEGAMMIMLSHGWVSSALFLCVGVLYDRYHTRLVKYYQGLTQAMPLFAIVFTFFSMANLGFPGTSSFAGEFMSLAGAFEANVTVAILAAIGTVLGAAYSVWLCNRVLFGPLQTEVLSGYSDLVRREAAVFAPLIFMTLWMGIYPEVFLQPIHLSILYLCA
jgi:NADH-quinone oxidoreductase subunit M